VPLHRVDLGGLAHPLVPVLSILGLVSFVIWLVMQ
jgi:hypothetical protein